MNTRDALLEAMRQHPDEDTPRLAYADLIEEEGDADLAAFIRRAVPCYCIVPGDELGVDPHCVSCGGKQWHPRCQHEGCRLRGFPCYLPMPIETDADQPTEHYCSVHAPEHGYCYRCGGFFAGIGSFEVGNGMCDECEREVREEEAPDYDEDGPDWDDEPVGSCENCGINLYRDDDPDYCDQCAWHMEQSGEDPGL